MTESLITFLGILFLCMFKFIAGPVLGYAAGYSLWEIMLVTVSGTMISVFAFTLLGDQLKRLLPIYTNRKSFISTERNPSMVRVWAKYGEAGVAFLTPLLLTPVGGTLILVAFGAKKRRIYFHMLWSALFWSLIFGLAIDQIIQIPFVARLIG